MEYIEKFSIPESISEAWLLIKNDIVKFIILYLMYFLIIYAVNYAD